MFPINARVEYYRVVQHVLTIISLRSSRFKRAIGIPFHLLLCARTLQPKLTKRGQEGIWSPRAGTVRSNSTAWIQEGGKVGRGRRHASELPAIAWSGHLRLFGTFSMHGHAWAFEEYSKHSHSLLNREESRRYV